MCSTAEEIRDVWKDFSCPMESGKLKEIARSGSFFSYCAGVVSYMLEWYNVGGVKITLTRMSLPMKSGLSSSATISVLVARVANALVYVCRADYTPKEGFAYINELQRDLTNSSLCTVLNGIDLTSRKNSYGYVYGKKYGYGYGMRYGYGYGAEKKE